MVYFTLGVLAVSAVLALSFAWIAWRQRPQPGTTAFAVGMLGLAWLLGCMLIGNTAEGVLEAPDLTFAFLRLKWIGTNVMAVGWVVFTLGYTGRGEYITRRVIAVLSIVPAISVFLLLVNDRMIEIVLSTVGFSIALAPFDWWLAFERFDVAYIYTLVIAGSVLILGLIVANRLPHPTQAGLWLVAISLPWGVNIAYLARILQPLGQPAISVDPAPLAFLVTGSVAIVAIVKYDTFETAPVARTHVVDELHAGVLVYDDECRVIDYNDWLAEVVNIPDGSIGGDVRGVLDSFVEQDNDPSRDADAVAESLRGTELAVEDGEESRHVSVEVSQLQRPEGLRIGYSVLVYDVTAQKQYQQALERSNEQLGFERDLKERIRDTLISVSSQSEIERAFCESVVGEDFPLVAIVESSPNGPAVRTAVGEQAFLKRQDGPGSLDVAETAISTERPELVTDPAALDGSEGSLAAEYGLGAALAIPLRHRGLTHGALVTYAARSHGFDDEDRRVFEDLAESIAYAIHAAQQRQSLRSDQRIELTFEFEGEGTPLGALATAAGEEPIEVTEVEAGEGVATQFLTVSGDGPPTVDGLGTHPRVQSADGDDASERTTLTVQEPTIASSVSALGGAVDTIRLTDGRVRVTAAFTRQADVEQILNRLREDGVDVTLVSQVYTEQAESEVRSLADLDLTDKQADALRAAYFSGFFERPQEKTAAEVAETLGVSRTTFLHHLRAAERRLMARVLEPR